MIKKQLYPHFTKLRRYLNNSEIEEYKNLTIRRSIYSVLSNEPIKVNIAMAPATPIDPIGQSFTTSDAVREL